MPRVVCALGYAAAFGFAVALYVRSADGHGVVADALQRDRLAAFATMILAGSGLLATAISYSGRSREEHVGEYYALLAAAGGGMAFFVGTNNLMTLFLGLEWFSLSLYILCAIDRDRLGGLEAALKYLIIGGFGSAVLLFGSALVYGATGELEFPSIAAAGREHDALFVSGLAMIIAGLAFKASAAPFHMWTPDVYEGAPTPVTAFMSAATKAAALVVVAATARDGVRAERGALDGRDRRDRGVLARSGQPRRARPEERQAHARVLVDLARGLHADRDLGQLRARRQGAALLPRPVRGHVARRRSPSSRRASASSASR